MWDLGFGVLRCRKMQVVVGGGVWVTVVRHSPADDFDLSSAHGGGGPCAIT